MLNTALKRARRITGISLAEEAFRIEKTTGPVDVPTVLQVLSGNLAAYHVHGFVSPDACRRIVSNFWGSSARVPRYGEGADGVEAYLIGASHYGKPTLTYLHEALACRDDVESVYAGTINPIAAFRNAIASKTNLSVRAASLDGLPAGDSKAVYWNNSGAFLLQPHEDLAQVRDPVQADFEIQEVNRVMALNVYASVQKGSGQLRVWNVEPDDETRDDLGLSGVGYPYPAELVEEYPSLTLAVETGDLCVINGNLVHAVVRGNTTVPKSRLLLTCFMGLNFSNEFIWWT
ncbi:MAG TPA: hypothetical protein VE980_14345 [Pyrinomonadaceae bacterium]|nr:hypothetical protein [Pyrinomonadaceae bacterium]